MVLLGVFALLKMKVLEYSYRPSAWNVVVLVM
jgi:hypothetical protein